MIVFRLLFVCKNFEMDKWVHGCRCRSICQPTKTNKISELSRRRRIHLEKYDLMDGHAQLSDILK